MNKHTRYILIILFAFASLASADQGGGDSYGYNWTDTEAPAPNTNFSWIDLAGETSHFGTVFNDSVASVVMPFSFTFYGNTTSQIYISSNGWLSFDNPGSNAYPTNQSIPNGASPNLLIAAYWDNLESTVGNNGGVYTRTEGSAPYRRFIVEWDIINGSDAINFEAILYEHTNVIKFQYNTIAAAYSGGGSATIGIEESGSDGLQYSSDTPSSVSAGSAILFHNESVSNYSASITPTAVQVSDFVSFTYTINNIDPGSGQGLGKIDWIQIANPFTTTPTITSVTIDGQSALIQNTTSKPTNPQIATWYYDTSGDPDVLRIQTTQFNVAQSITITYLQAIPEVVQGDYNYDSMVDAALYAASPVSASSQPQVTVSYGDVDYIVIRDASGGNGNIVGNRTLTTDSSLTFYAAGYDAGDNYIDDYEVDWTVTGTLDGSDITATSYFFNPSTAPTSGTIQAEINGTGISDATGTITVNPGDLASLEIQTAGGVPVTTLNMTTDQSQTFRAAGFDADNNFRGTEAVTWTSAAFGGINVPGQATLLFQSTVPDTGILTVTSGSISDNTGNIGVTVGNLNYLVISDAPNGTGGEFTSLTMTADDATNLYAAGYDQHGNYRQDENANWSVTGTLDGPGPTGSPSFNFSPSNAPTSGSIIATVGSIGDATGTITVNPGTLASLEIRTAPNDGGNLVSTLTMTTDQSQTFWAAGFDAEDNFTGNESVTWTSAAFGGINQPGQSLLFAPSAPDTGILTITSGSVNYATGNIAVTAGALNYLIIRNGPNNTGSAVTTVTMTVDNNVTLYAAGYDVDGNYRQDEPADWDVTGSLDGPGPTGSPSFNFSPSSAPTSGSIVATVGGIADATGTITVNPGTLTSLEIRTAPNDGGSLVTTLTMTTDQSQTFWAAGFDAEDNFTGNEVVTWTSAAFGGINQPGQSLLFEPSAPDTGILTITSGSVNYSTGNIGVTAGALNYLIIRNGPNNTGSAVTTINMLADDNVTLYAAGYDVDGNYRQDEPADWDVTGSLDGPGPTGSPSFNFSPVTAPTTGSIVATVGSISDGTGTITVSPGALSSLLIRTAALNGGNQVTTYTLTTDESQTFWSAGYDADGNYRGDESGTVWTSSGTLGLSGGPSASIFFDPTVPVSGTLTATVGGSIAYTTGQITVNTGGIDHIIIRDAPDGGGNEVVNRTITADDAITLYAAGYDAGDTFVQNAQVNWSVTGTLDGAPLSDTVYVFNPTQAPTTGTIVAKIGTKQDVTGTITVNPGALSSLLIRTAANNSGDPVTTISMTTDESRTFWSAGYDADGNFRGDETTTSWTSTGTLGLSGGPSASIFFDPTAPVSGTLTATVGGTIAYTTGTIDVTGGVIDHIIIRDAPDGGGNEVANRSITADDSITLYAAGYDAGDTFVQNAQVNWTVTGNLDLDGTPLSDTVFVFNPTTAPTSGTIVAQLGTKQDVTGTITVTPGALSSLLIRTASNNGGDPVTTFPMTTDQSQTFWSAGYDADGNYRGDETTTMWTSSGTLGLSGGPSASIFFDPTAPVSGTLTATVGGSIAYTTGTIDVTGGVIDHIIIRDAPDGGGNEVVNRAITADDSITLYAAGYDAGDTFVQNAQVNWTVTGSLDVTGTPLSDTVFVFRPTTAPTSGAINAQLGTMQDATGTISVTYGALASLLIRDAANNSGGIVTILSMSAGQSRTFWAAGYDADGNYRLDETATVWTSTFGLGTTGSSFLFTPTVPGEGTITATIGTVQYITGNISVQGGTLAYMVIRDSTNGGGNSLTGTPQSLTADQSLNLFAAGYDASDNYIGDQSVDWYSTGSLDDINVTGTAYTFNPVEAPTSGTIGITNGTFGNTTGTITVSVGVLNYIKVNSAAGAAGTEVDTLSMTAGSTKNFYASGYDSDGNYRSAVTVNWSSTGNLDSVTGTGTSIQFSPVTAPSVGTIVADMAGLFTDATGLITVNEGNLHHILVRSATGGNGIVIGDTIITTDSNLSLFAAGYDINNNYLYDVSVSWSSTGGLDNVSATGTSYIFNPATASTIGTIVATSGLYSGQTGTITVNVGILHHVQINSTSGAAGLPFESLTMTADNSVTLYAAGYDADNNFRNMVSATWDQTGTLDNVAGTGSSYIFNPVTAPTSGTITATFSGFTDPTGMITVNQGILHHILISDDTTTVGSEFGDITIPVGFNLTLYSVGYDQHDNLRGLENALWRSTGSLDPFSGVSGQSFVFTPNTAPTSGTIIATSGTISDTTGTITVELGGVASIKIRTAANGGGVEFTTHNMTADESVTLYAAGYDGGNNYVDNQVVDWSSTGSLETITATGTSFVFSPTVAPASGTIRATSGVLNDETGTITVNPGVPASITDFDGLSGERTTIAGRTQLIRVLVADQDGNPVNGVTVNFTPAVDMSVPSDITDANGLAESVYNTPLNTSSSIVQTSVTGLSPYNFTVYGITYVSGSLDPAVAQRGNSPSFTVQVSNPGNVPVPLSTASSNFSFRNGSFVYSANLVSPTSLAANTTTTLTFAAALIDDFFPGGAYTAEIKLVGSGAYSSMNGILYTDLGELTIGSDAITIGTVQIVGPNGTGQLLPGDQGVTATVPVTNLGPVLTIDPFQNTRIEFRNTDTEQLQPVNNLQRTDALTSLQSGGVVNELEFTFDLPSDYPVGQIEVYVVLSLDGGNLVIGPQLSGSFPVLEAGTAIYVQGSLAPTGVVPQQTVNFSASFENTGTASIVLSPLTSTIEIVGSGIGTRNLISQFTIQGHSITEIHFSSMQLPPGLSPGSYDIEYHLNGTLSNNSPFDTTNVLTDAITVVSPANLVFSDINVVPARVKLGQTGVDIVYTIRNNGFSEANINSIIHNFNFVSGGAVPANQWIPTQVSPALPVVLNPLESVSITTTYAISSMASIGIIRPNPTVNYHDVRTPSIPKTSNVIEQNDQVEVVQPATLKIVRLEAQAPNVPYVNTDQPFTMELTLENTGVEQIQTVWVSVFRNSESVSFRDQLIISDITSGMQKSTNFQHSEPASGTYLYTAYVDSAKDVVGDPVLINQPSDRDELLYLQTPSSLEIDAVIISDSGTSDSLVVSENQTFTVRANISNSGESSFTPDGNGRFILRLPGGTFSFINGPADTSRIFTEDVTSVEWPVKAVGISPGGMYQGLVLELRDVPVDANTGNEVANVSLTDDRVHVKSEEVATVVMNDADIISPEGATDNILSTYQEFTVQATVQFNATVATASRQAEIMYPSGYALKSGEQKIFNLSAGGTAHWTLIAPDHDRSGDEIYAVARGNDRNSGLAVSLNSNIIGTTVVERTDLSMTLSIVKTAGSPGDTLSVGQKFRLEALINNVGTAQAVGQGKIYLEGIVESDLIIYSNLPQDDTLSFTVGEPVGWDLEVIQLPETKAGIESEIFRLMKELDERMAAVPAKGLNTISGNNGIRDLFNQISDMRMTLETEEINLTVKMSQIPEDENTNQTAFTEDSVVTKPTYIQPVAKITFGPFHPPLTVSTGQVFNVTVSGVPENNLVNARAHLLIPESFESANGDTALLELPLEEGTNQARFQVAVPSTNNYFGAAVESLSVYLSGEDSNTGEPVLPSVTLTRALNVQMKPEIYMASEIISPIAARESGSLSHGQTITIDVWPVLFERSDKPLTYADINEDGSIEIDNKIFTQYNFEPIEGEQYNKPFTDLEQKIRFSLRAPRENKTALIDIKFADLPIDENSGDFVTVNPDSGSVSLPMTVIAKNITVTMEKEYDKTTFTRGEGQHFLLAFEISNGGYQDPLTLAGIGLKFIARSDTATLVNNAITDIFEKIIIIDYDEYLSEMGKISKITGYADYEVTEANVQNPLQIAFDEPGILPGNGSAKLAVLAMFRAGESSRSFRVILNNVTAYDDTPENLVSIIDPEGRSITGNANFITEIYTTLSRDQEKSFGNFPNPFGRPPNETTEIRFLLNSTSDVNLRIFSLAGELVRSSWNSNLTNLAGGDVYYVVWDGKNDAGDTVLNGVYICVIEIKAGGGTKTFTTKIAYIK